jgi:hypothetical protein
MTSRSTEPWTGRRAMAQTASKRPRRGWIAGAGTAAVVAAVLLLVRFSVGDSQPRRPAVPREEVLEPAPPLADPVSQVPAPAPQRAPSAIPAPAGPALGGSPGPAAAAFEESPAVLQERARLAELTSQAHDLVAAALEELRPTAVAKCWPDASPGGPRLQLTWSLAFGRDGGETVRSVNVAGDDVPGEVQTCLRDYPVPPFHIAAPAQRIRTEVVVSYP